jgi:hypothetical protein
MYVHQTDQKLLLAYLGKMTNSPLFLNSLLNFGFSTRVTILGEFSPNGRLFAFGQFIAKYRIMRKFSVYFFHGKGEA